MNHEEPSFWRGLLCRFGWHTFVRLPDGLAVGPGWLRCRYCAVIEAEDHP
jgi:hypothetical protein